MTFATPALVQLEYFQLYAYSVEMSQNPWVKANRKPLAVVKLSGVKGPSKTLRGNYVTRWCCLKSEESTWYESQRGKHHDTCRRGYLDKAKRQSRIHKRLQGTKIATPETNFLCLNPTSHTMSLKSREPSYWRHSIPDKRNATLMNYIHIQQKCVRRSWRNSPRISKSTR